MTLRKDGSHHVIFGSGTTFVGELRFKETLSIKGTFQGTIEAVDHGDLIVEEGANVEATKILVTSLVIRGTVSSPVDAADKIVICPGGRLKGDIKTRRLQIADKMFFEGQISMVGDESEVDIFSRPTEDIKAELQDLFEKND
ncbi:MAG: polymer-forming cytoskeletal protein [Treponema sp.]|jgi:cytoskeletal protein CcmA (bactofilin family)|nr:polymer-forming cytoskeletal protein [Treponema sp.]